MRFWLNMLRNTGKVIGMLFRETLACLGVGRAVGFAGLTI